VANKGILWVRIWIGFGFITILSGIYLAVQGDYLIGISGSLVGVWLIAMNVKHLNSSDKE
jgi:hypothetical protein